ncbi:MAG: hypothetical protein ACLQUY_23790 [Ktedonobacterales bacterium]
MANRQQKETNEGEFTTSSSTTESSVNDADIAASTEHQEADTAAGEVPGEAGITASEMVDGLQGLPGVYPATASGASMAESDRAVLEENARLRREVADLRAKEERRRHPGRARRTLVGVLVVLSCLGILASTLTVWSSTTLLNTDTWLQIVGPIAQNPQVIQSFSSYTASQVVMVLDVKQRTEQALPPKATFLATPLTQAVQSFIQSSVARLMHTPTFQKIWINTNRIVYTEVLAALRGQSSTLHISNGVVTLNLIPIIDEALQYIQQHLPGLISQHVRLPVPSQLEVPQSAQQKLSKALGFTVPSNLGQIELFQSAQLATAQRLLRLWDFLSVALPVITAVLIALTLWLSRDRRRTLMELGIGIAITFILLKIALDYLQQYILGATMNPTAKSVVQPTLQTVFGGLDTINSWLLAGGLVLAIVAYLFGKPEWFRAIYAYLRSGYQWVIGKIEEWRHQRHRPPQAAAGAA